MSQDRDKNSLPAPGAQSLPTDHRPLTAPPRLAESWRYWVSANPALHRELLLGDSRSRRQAAPTRRLLEILSWLGLLLVLTTYGVVLWWLGRPDRDPLDARIVLMTACVAYLALVTLAIPASAATAISGEGERENWQELLLTALHPRQLVVAKFLSALRSAGALWLAALPVLLTSLHAGRLPGAHWGELLLLLAAAPVLVTAVSLWLSARCRRSRNAVTWAYVLVGITFWGSLAAYSPLALRGENLWWYLSPAWHAALLCWAEPNRSPLAVPLLPEWLWFVFFCATVSALCLALLVRRVAGWTQH